MCLVFDVDDYESITVSNTAIGVTAAKIPNHNYAFVTVETDQIRFRVDGTDPTASEGHLFEAGDTFELMGGRAIINFKAIRVTTDATLRVSLGYREEGMP